MDRLHAASGEERGALQSRIDLMIPVIKGWLTEMGQEVTSLGVQVHGGMGYIEETGAAQYVRDVRITSIYEGTTGIQAADFVTRKLGRDNGATMGTVLQEIYQTLNAIAAADEPRFEVIRQELTSAVAQFENTTEALLRALPEDVPAVLSASFDYLMQAGYLFGGWHLARSALVALERLREGSDNRFYETKVATAGFYSGQILPRCAGHTRAITNALSASRLVLTSCLR
jgi:hypothetical protein